MSKIKDKVFYILIGVIILIVLFLRTKLYLTGGVFEDDECRLACSMFGLSIWQMFGPIGPWSSSPIFMFVSKIIAHFSYYNEYALQFLPYVFSVAGIFVFYKLCKDFFTRKYSVIAAMFLFAINSSLVYFSAAFKHYSLELLIGILCLYYLPKINYVRIDKKRFILLSIVFAVLPLLSLPSLFYMAAFVIVNFFLNLGNKKEFFKKSFLMFSPFLAVMIVYCIFNLAPTRIMQLSIYREEWQEFYATDFFSLIVGNFNYFFSATKTMAASFATLILFITSVLTICFYKKERNSMNIFPVLVFVLVVLASVLHIYPYMSRVATHLVPAIILILLKPMDCYSPKKIPFYLIIMLLITAFWRYFTPEGLTNIYTCENALCYSPKTLMQTIAKNFSPETDRIITNEATAASYYFYAKKYKIPNFENISTVIVASGADTEGKVKKVFDSLNPKNNYWIYIVKDYSRFPSSEFITRYANRQKIKIYKQELQSYLYYIVPPYMRAE